jgi:hypothetical protein
MAEEIVDGKGTRNGMRVDPNGQAHVFAVTEKEIAQATTVGNGFNINSGNITISGDSALLYLKNDEDTPITVDSLAVGIGTPQGGSFTDTPEVYLVINPTSGTIVSGAADADMVVNRNGGSNKTFKPSTLVYKGADGNTITNGEDFALFYQGSGRLFADIGGVEIPRGSSLALRIVLPLSAGTVKVYAAYICYLKDQNNI